MDCLTQVSYVTKFLQVRTFWDALNPHCAFSNKITFLYLFYFYSLICMWMVNGPMVPIRPGRHDHCLSVVAVPEELHAAIQEQEMARVDAKEAVDVFDWMKLRSMQRPSTDCLLQKHCYSWSFIFCYVFFWGGEIRFLCNQCSQCQVGKEF